MDVVEAVFGSEVFRRSRFSRANLASDSDYELSVAVIGFHWEAF
jgi:hypothetical protein